MKWYSSIEEAQADGVDALAITGRTMDETVRRLRKLREKYDMKAVNGKLTLGDMRIVRYGATNSTPEKLKGFTKVGFL